MGSNPSEVLIGNINKEEIMTREEIRELRDLIMARKDCDGQDASKIIAKPIGREPKTVYNWFYTQALPTGKTVLRTLDRMLKRERRLANATI
jgi:hypothetical protein